MSVAAPSTYLTGPADYETYGVPLTSQAHVIRASLLIDHYLRRPEGCVWAPDANGQPAYMTAATPSLVYSTSMPILAGKSVVVQLPNYSGDTDSLIGEVVILDRLVQGLTEACIVQAEQADQVTLTNVQFDHLGTSLPVTLEFGMTICEEISMPNQRSVAQLQQWPVANIMSGLGRYGYGRRTDQNLGFFYDANLLSTLSAFGGPPAWTPFTVAASSLNPRTGDLWVPAGTLLAYYTDIKMRYCAGWPANNLPPQIKVACASIVHAMAASPMGPQIRRFNAGKVSVDRFADTVLDPDIKSMLRPYMANWAL